MKYEGWNNWQFVREHPGPLPEIHASLQIRPVYVDDNEEPEQQKYWRKPVVYHPYDMD